LDSPQLEKGLYEEGGALEGREEPCYIHQYFVDKGKVPSLGDLMYGIAAIAAKNYPHWMDPFTREDRAWKNENRFNSHLSWNSVSNFINLRKGKNQFREVDLLDSTLKSHCTDGIFAAVEFWHEKPHCSVGCHRCNNGKYVLRGGGATVVKGTKSGCTCCNHVKQDNQSLNRRLHMVVFNKQGEALNASPEADQQRYYELYYRSWAMGYPLFGN
jgi:hypothetical protein